jgi:tetratricopeptide (TPR) repeat protein
MSKRSALVYAVMILAAVSTGSPVAADHPSDVKLCFSSSSDESDAAKRVPVCTRIINSGRLNKADLSGAYNWRGEAHRILHQNDDALADFAKSIETNPQSVYPHTNRAELYRNMGKYDLAIADVTEAIRLDPALTASYTVRGLAYEKIGNTAKARTDFNTALSIPIKGFDGAWAQEVARTHLEKLQ